MSDNPPATHAIAPEEFKAENVVGPNDMFQGLSAAFAGWHRVGIDHIGGRYSDRVYAIPLPRMKAWLGLKDAECLRITSPMVSALCPCGESFEADLDDEIECPECETRWMVTVGRSD